MKKILPIMIFAFALATMNVSIGDACGGSSCSKWKKSHSSAAKSKCKVKKLKKQVKKYYMMRDHIGLSHEQLDQIRDIGNEAVKKMIQYTADKKIVMVDVKSEMWREMINADKIKSLIDKKYAAKTSLAKTYVQALADMQEVLDEKQRKLVYEMRLDHKKDCNKGCCGKCGGDKKCSKSGWSGDGAKMCPITGKPLSSKGSMKGSSKNDM